MVLTDLHKLGTRFYQTGNFYERKKKKELKNTNSSPTICIQDIMDNFIYKMVLHQNCSLPHNTYMKYET